MNSDRIKTLKSTINYRANRVSQFSLIRDELTNRCLDASYSVKSKIDEKEVINVAREYYKKATDYIYEQSIASLKRTLDTSLRYIFYDKNYSVVIEIDDKRGSKTVNLILRDDDEDLEVDTKDGIGNGVRSVISCILILFTLLNKNSDVLLLDETYSAISTEYITRFFEVFRQLVQERKLTVALITHDERFMHQVDGNIYRVSDGVVMKVDQ